MRTKYKQAHYAAMKEHRQGTVRRSGFAGVDYESITTFLRGLFDTRFARPKIVGVLLLGLLAFAGCGSVLESAPVVVEPKAPAFVVPENQPAQPVVEPTKPEPVTVAAPECENGQCALPSRGESAAPVRRVIENRPRLLGRVAGRLGGRCGLRGCR